MSRYWNYVMILAFIGINAWFLLGSAQYFVKTPNELIYVVAASAVGGLLAVLYFKLEANQRHKAKLLFWGMIGVCSSFMLISGLIGSLWFFYLVKPSPLPIETSAMPLLGFLAVVVALTCLSWREFIQIRNKER